MCFAFPCGALFRLPGMVTVINSLTVNHPVDLSSEMSSGYDRNPTEPHETKPLWHYNWLIILPIYLSQVVGSSPSFAAFITRLVGGWTNPVEKYACQIGWFPNLFMISPRFNAEKIKNPLSCRPPPTSGWWHFLLNHCSLGKKSLRAWCNPVSSPHFSPLAGSSVTWASRGAEGDNHTYNCLVTYRNQRYLEIPQNNWTAEGLETKQNIPKLKKQKTSIQ